MICIIRITGQVNLKGDIKETFNRLGLRRKYSCTVIHLTKENKGMIKKVGHFSAFGSIKKAVF